MIDKKVLRSLTLEAFRRAPETQFETRKRNVTELAADHGFLDTESTGGLRLTYHTETQFPVHDQNILQEVVWDLIVERVLTPGTDALSAEWPWLRMTGRNMASIS